jgi:uncharacterized integral membrane protein (TIGR00697 family)
VAKQRTYTATKPILKRRKVNKKTIWAIVLLVGGYIICQAVADIGATKMVEIGGIIIPAGTFIFAATFTIRDLIHKRLGKEWARAAIVCAGIFNVAQSAYLATMALLPAPVFFGLGDAWNSVFAIVPAITIGSIVAEVASELVDTEVYHLWQRLNLPQWTSVLASNAISLPLDSAIFGVLAFSVLPPLFGAESMPVSTALVIASGQILWKGAITVVSLPTIYAVKKRQMIKSVAA